MDMEPQKLDIIYTGKSSSGFHFGEFHVDFFIEGAGGWLMNGLMFGRGDHYQDGSAYVRIPPHREKNVGIKFYLDYLPRKSRNVLGNHVANLLNYLRDLFFQEKKSPRSPP